MKTGRRASPAIWLWNVVNMVAPRSTRITGFVPAGRSAPPPAMRLDLPSGWALVHAAPPPASGALSRGTRSLMGALTWYEQPLTLAR